MLAKIEMEIEGNGLDVNMSSLFHGYLMNSIDSAYGIIYIIMKHILILRVFIKMWKVEKYFGG